MAAATINRSYSALPWYGAVVYVFEFSSGGAESGDTIDLTDFGDSGTGISSGRGLLDFTTAGRIITAASASSFTAANGTVVSVGTDTGLITTVVIGR